MRVEYLGEVHSATWPDDADEGDLEDVAGDESLLRAALMAWSGEESFELSAEELSERSGGYWEKP